MSFHEVCVGEVFKEVRWKAGVCVGSVEGKSIGVKSRCEGGRRQKGKKSGRSSSRKKGASPGIEPGPLAPEANIIPLNYEAVQ